MSDRYRIGAVTGFPIVEGEIATLRHSSPAEPTTTFYVLDSAYGYREIGSFDKLEDAEALATKLNAEHDAEHAELQRQLKEGIPF